MLAESTTIARGDEFTIGVSFWDISSTPAAAPIVAGMRESAAGVKLIPSDPKWNASTQLENIRDFVTQKLTAPTSTRSKIPSPS
jgi:hypothetical protein